MFKDMLLDARNFKQHYPSASVTTIMAWVKVQYIVRIYNAR